MSEEVPASTKAIGFWSAVAATVLGVAYDLARLVAWTGPMGTDGLDPAAQTSSFSPS